MTHAQHQHQLRAAIANSYPILGRVFVESGGRLTVNTSGIAWQVALEYAAATEDVALSTPDPAVTIYEETSTAIVRVSHYAAGCSVDLFARVELVRGQDEMWQCDDVALSRRSARLIEVLDGLPRHDLRCMICNLVDDLPRHRDAPSDAVGMSQEGWV